MNQNSKSEMRWQGFRSENGIFKLRYPALWELLVVEDVPSFFDPLDGQGALQAVSLPATVLEDGSLESLPSIFNSYVERLGVTDRAAAGVKPVGGVGEDGHEMLMSEFRLEGRFWFLVLKRLGTATVLAFYNSDVSPDRETGWILSEIVKSITITGN